MLFYLVLPMVVNASVLIQVFSLAVDLLAPVDPCVIIAGMSKICQVGINMVLSHKSKEITLFQNWVFLAYKENIFDVVEDPKDVPLWWFCESDVRRLQAARRDTSDPREYWWWKRCTSKENDIEMGDVFNPDPARWLEDCDVDVECSDVYVFEEYSRDVLGTIEEEEHEGEENLEKCVL